MNGQPPPNPPMGTEVAGTENMQPPGPTSNPLAERLKLKRGITISWDLILSAILMILGLCALCALLVVVFFIYLAVLFLVTFARAALGV